MKFANDLRIKTATSWFPPDHETVEDAIAAGKLDQSDADKIGVTRLPVSTRLSAPEMAVAAARDAISRAGWHPSKVGLVLHTWIYHQGHDMWSPPHFVANEVGTPEALAYGVYQGCNGAALSLHLAAMHLASDPGLGGALITTGDRFEPPASAAGPATTVWATATRGPRYCCTAPTENPTTSHSSPWPPRPPASSS